MLSQHYMCLTYTVPTIHSNDAIHATPIIPIIHTTHTIHMKQNYYIYHAYHTQQTYIPYLPSIQYQPFMPYIPYLPNIPYFPNMPCQTDHTHHTYPTNDTTPPPHYRGGRGTVPHPDHTTGSEVAIPGIQGALDWGPRSRLSQWTLVVNAAARYTLFCRYASKSWATEWRSGIYEWKDQITPHVKPSGCYVRTGMRTLQLHYTTFHYTTLHYTPLHYT